jgi:hypothetical protein
MSQAILHTQAVIDALHETGDTIQGDTKEVAAFLRGYVTDGFAGRDDDAAEYLEDSGLLWIVPEIVNWETVAEGIA